jgi:ligand-binding SRPBCC domain-containing protein
MPRLVLTTVIFAPAERVFDLSRSIDLHAVSTATSGERAVGGVTTGLIGMGQEVTWRARHFGVWQNLTSRITVFDRPRHFQDIMVRGAFRRFTHDHFFDQVDNGTQVRDIFDYESPLGFLSRAADVLFLERYMRRFLTERNAILKTVAESDEWKRYL